MICQICKKRNATTHYKQTVNGKTSEIYVCSECAAKQGIGLIGNSLDVSNFFGGLFATTPILRETEAEECCPICKKSFRDIVQSGVVGCAECYVQFFDRLQPSIQRIHGKTAHVGKIAANGSAESRTKREIARLKEELTKALAAQEYERCAELRDKIHELEDTSNEG